MDELMQINTPELLWRYPPSNFSKQALQQTGILHIKFLVPLPPPLLIIAPQSHLGRGMGLLRGGSKMSYSHFFSRTIIFFGFFLLDRSFERGGAFIWDEGGCQDFSWLHNALLLRTIFFEVAVNWICA